MNSSNDTTTQATDTTTQATCGSEPKPIIVLALKGNEFPSESLKRAGQLCEAMGAELRVLRVLAYYPVVSPSLRPFDVDDAVRAHEQLDGLRDATRGWVQTRLGQELPPSQLEVVRGDFVEVSSARSRDVGAALIVVAPSRGLLDAGEESLAALSNLPVLVARWSDESDPVLVAATDLEDTRLPVLRAASELAERLGTSLVPVHNVSPLPVLMRCLKQPGRALRERASWADDARTETRRRLATAADQLALEQPGVVSNDHDVAGAILQEARNRKADLVIVGLRRRSGFVDWLKPSVATSVVRGARRSVLITPVAPRGRANSARRDASLEA